MEIRYLQEFVILSQKLNYTQAAEELFLSQSVLSKHIQSLEKELGAPLFKRHTRSIELTEFGKHYLPFARSIAQQYRDSEESRKHFFESKNNTIVFGVINNIHEFRIDTRLMDFRKEFPQYRFKLIEASMNQLQEMFQNGEIHIFTASLADGETGPFHYLPIARGEAKAYLRKDHPLAKNDSVSLVDLTDENIILSLPNTGFPKYIEDLFRQYCPSKKVFTYGSLEYGKMQAEIGNGITLFPVEGVPDPISEDMVVRAIEPAFRYTYGLGYRKDALNTTEKTFVAFIKKRYGL